MGVNPVVPLLSVAATIPPRLCSVVKETIPVVVLSSKPPMDNPIPIFVNNLSFVSLVILLSGSFVITCPSGCLTAKDLDARGLSSTLSLSSCGYTSTTFWLYFKSLNSSDETDTPLIISLGPCTLTKLLEFSANNWYTPSCVFLIYSEIILFLNM